MEHQLTHVIFLLIVPFGMVGWGRDGRDSSVKLLGGTSPLELAVCAPPARGSFASTTSTSAAAASVSVLWRSVSRRCVNKQRELGISRE